MTRRPAFEFETGNFALCIQTRLHIDYSWRTERRPTLLVFTHPLNAYGLADSLRQESRLRHSVITSKSSIGTGSFDPHASHFLQRQTQHLGEVAAVALYPLRARPECRLAGADISHRA